MLPGNAADVTVLVPVVDRLRQRFALGRVCVAAIRGHVFCSFLALMLRNELQDRHRVAGFRPEWGDVLRDLDRLQDVEIDQGGKYLILRTPATGVAGRLFQAARVALPPNVRDDTAAA